MKKSDVVRGRVESHPSQKRRRMGHPRHGEFEEKRGMVGYPPRSETGGLDEVADWLGYETEEQVEALGL